MSYTHPEQEPLEGTTWQPTPIPPPDQLTAMHAREAAAVWEAGYQAGNHAGVAWAAGATPPEKDNPHEVALCDRCGRESHPWPLKRGNSCSPADWVNCIREVSS